MFRQDPYKVGVQILIGGKTIINRDTQTKDGYVLDGVEHVVGTYVISEIIGGLPVGEITVDITNYENRKPKSNQRDSVVVSGPFLRSPLPYRKTADGKRRVDIGRERNWGAQQLSTQCAEGGPLEVRITNLGYARD